MKASHDARRAPEGEADSEELRCEACGREARSPLGIPIAGWRDILWRVKEELNDDHVTVIAAGVAFFGLLAFVPLLGSLVALYGLWADPGDVARHLSTFSEVLPAAGGKLVRTVLEDVVDRSHGQLSLSAVAGIAVTLWSASRGMRSLMRALTIAYDEDARRGWMRERALSYGYTAIAITIGALTIGVVVAVPAALAWLGLSGWAGFALLLLRWPALAIVSVAALATLYRWGPARRPAKWRWVVTGAGLATVLWLLGSSVLSIYVHRVASIDDSYGPLGAVLVLMLWFFVASYAVLLGAELNAEMEHQTRVDTTAGPDRPMGKRGAHVADRVGPCRPPIRHLIKTTVKRAHTRARQVATDLRDRARRS
jgi:membrane protein